jgi:hypothetical protein
MEIRDRAEGGVREEMGEGREEGGKYTAETIEDFP